MRYNSLTDLITDAAKRNCISFAVTFPPVYDESKHGHLPDRLKESMKVAKRTIFHIVEDIGPELLYIANTYLVEWIPRKTRQ